jgi:hypothetical protein
MGKHLKDFRQGDTYVYGVEQFATDDTGADVPVDLSGCRLTLSLTSSFDEPPVFTFSKIAGDHITDKPAQGLIKMVLESEFTRLIPAGKYYYDVQLEMPDGTVSTVLPPLEVY